MKVSIVGTGYVGLVTGVLFADKGHDVLCIENNRHKLQKLQNGQVPFYEPGLQELMTKNKSRLRFSDSIEEGVKHAKAIFVAVGTPALASGEPDMTYIERVAMEIAQYLDGYRLIVEKSTVPVHTSEKIHETIKRFAPQGVEFEVASNPEFLREGQALEDAFNPDRIVFGVPSVKAEKILSEIYKDFSAPLIVTNVNSAEIIKHAANSFLAMKISYINAVASICELSGANIEEVAKGIGLDRRIGEHFLRAGVGYGGSCFPKDVDAFVNISRELGYDFALLEEVQKINHRQKKRFLKKIKETLWVVKNKTIAIWGLSFKPNTDDMREAPALDVINELKREQAKIKIYDPQAIQKANEILQMPAIDNHTQHLQQTLQDVELCSCAYDVVTDVDCLLILTEWAEFDSPDWEVIKQKMKQKIVIDGRNMYDPKKMEQLGFIYKSVGR
ncbi:UDP-glucose dehydrogenase family protein [Candidatus Uabimicrobium amorphum]|uniref:UDP-glucose 6-dehydrogenase n=1 Tax=Uabimicrobium amorphum TaxID=2596890 RepID=A0A5S9IPT7_UABAM|nr:UDP-glucose/GDP-mannose dehydrogenase family protein [Candidatus Uabimicrobium amorphum]BBM84930.1 UDP-glucose 6-dehydrogenase [Candidatus Uabimicrobium amorphum]